MSNLRRSLFVAESFVFIYFNPNKLENQEFISRWCDSLLYPIQTFDDMDLCVDYLTDLRDQVFLILADISCETVVPLIHDLPQLVHIYIVCEKITEEEDWMKSWKKIQIISNDTVVMFDQFHRHVRHASESSVPVSVTKPSSPTNPNKLDPSFMYSLLLKEVILQFEYNEKAKKQFVDFSRENASKFMTSLAKIDEFEQHYTSQSAIWWYTKEPFIYFTMNHALRTNNVDVIMKMDFYIQDLYRELEKLRSNAEQNTKITLYRGQGMSITEFQYVQYGEGSFLSFNSFLSTSCTKSISYFFADAARHNPDLVGVLFIMEIDPSFSTVPFASLDGLSHHGEEQEILFSMNTIFRIAKTEIIDDRLWEVNLILTDDTDPQLTELTEHIRKVTDGSGAICQLGSLMIEIFSMVYLQIR
ncbi:unnamed protein product [Didymodactylos carnosus]|uniref:NAD(P)(+)--arginine ADP-ribosyltransferase n=1 Tax=Didymodactylos carnosus TaxID=1234261 RepID=A0A8S2EAH2_9BILA|nr:unnamed protein product [Didymodactylos carnosus]CAF3878024.1 unnamed protein product [Didymodactylos carnosus]